MKKKSPYLTIIHGRSSLSSKRVFPWSKRPIQQKNYVTESSGKTRKTSMLDFMRKEISPYMRETLVHICIISIALFALLLQAKLISISGGRVPDITAIARDFIIAYSDFVIAFRCALIISKSALTSLMLIVSVIEAFSKGKRPPSIAY